MVRITFVPSCTTWSLVANHAKMSRAQIIGGPGWYYYTISREKYKKIIVRVCSGFVTYQVEMGKLLGSCLVTTKAWVQWNVETYEFHRLHVLFSVIQLAIRRTLFYEPLLMEIIERCYWFSIFEPGDISMHNCLHVGTDNCTIMNHENVVIGDPREIWWTCSFKKIKSNSK